MKSIEFINIFEGGNIYKNQDGSEATRRILKAEILPTIQYLEKITGLPLVDNMLGTTGKKESSGDLDLAVDATTISKEDLVQKLLAAGFDKPDVRKTGDSVHLKTPINGNPSNGFVQTDFMFGNPSWQKFSMGAAADSQFKGSHRHVLMASIAKARGMRWSYKNGLTSRTTGNVISMDPDEISEILIGGNADDLSSVERILAKIKNDPEYNDLVADARETFAKEGYKLP